MIKNIIGAVVGSSVAQSAPVKGGAAGAAIASAIPFVISRMSIPAMVALGVGGYFAKRYYDKRKAEEQTPDKSTDQSVGELKSATALGTDTTGTSQDDAPKPAAVTNGSGTSPHPTAIASM